MGKEEQVSQILEVMDGYVVELNKFYKMSESDWVILRLVFDSDRQYSETTDEETNSISYLFKKYGFDLVSECLRELKAIV